MPELIYPYSFSRGSSTSLRPFEDRSLETFEDDPSSWYKMLRAYYDNNGLYDDLKMSEFYLKQWSPAMKPLRNPAHRAVEFFVSKIWAGTLPAALPIITKNAKIIPAIQQFWSWGNWAAKKQVASRHLALYGDWFCRVGTSEASDHIYPQNILPQNVTEFEEDERGFLTKCRIDIPQDDDDGYEAYHIEIWDDEKKNVRIWEKARASWGDDAELGPPTETHDFSEYGIDFIPIVHAQFKDIGEERGYSCLTHALDKIDELNQVATRLHQLLFRYNKPLWAMSANMMDPSGRPLPSPTIAGKKGTALELKDDSIVDLPGMSTLTPLIPPIDYGSSLAVVNEMLTELERDLPELKYSALFAKGEMSGRAIRLLMSDAIDRLIEARGNAESALIRLDQMALTIGSSLGLDGFKGVGSFDAGDFNHSFAERDPFPISASEKAATFGQLAGAGMPFEAAMTQAGYTREEIELARTERDIEVAKAQAQLAASLAAGQKKFNSGGNP